jgi:A/G-specific DNA glycosylase
MQIPVKAPKKPRKIEKRTVFIFEYQGKYALHQRSDTGLLAGLWELPNVEHKLTIPKVEQLLQKIGVTDYQMELLGDAKHIFSHIEWHMLGYRIHMNQLTDLAEFEDILWADKQQLNEQYALPTAFSAYYKYIRDKI